jgi:hypothetical protein
MNVNQVGSILRGKWIHRVLTRAPSGVQRLLLRHFFKTQYPIEAWAGYPISVLEHPLLLIKLSILITTASPPLTETLLLLDRWEAYIVYVVALQNEMPWAYQVQA